MLWQALRVRMIGLKFLVSPSKTYLRDPISYFMVFSHKFLKEQQKQALQIWKEIEKMKTSGKMAEIKKKYEELKQFP